MKLNKNKPYGTTYGHPAAMYEQDGVLFDGSGEEVTPAATKAAKVAELKTESGDSVEETVANSFLTNLLSGGPMSRDNVYKAAGDADQPWSAVDSAAAKMGVVRQKVKSIEVWRLAAQ